MKVFTILALMSIAFQGYCETPLHYGGQSMTGELKRVLVRRPDINFARAEPSVWHYKAEPNLIEAQKEHDAFVMLLKKHGVEVFYHQHRLPNHADAIFVQDPVIITDAGAIILKMGKFLRRGEESSIKQSLKTLNIPILFELSGEATAEASDAIWLDENTLAIARSFRTNQTGIEQVKGALSPYNIDVISVELPYASGEESSLHLQSLLSIVDFKKALIYKKLLPLSFIQRLKDMGYTLIDVDEKEYSHLATNVLCIKPRLCIMLEGNPTTKKRLENANIRILTYKGHEISEKPDNGPTHLTRSLLRADAQAIH